MLVTTLPFAITHLKNYILKYGYLLLVVISVALLIKSRALSLLLIPLFIFYLINDFKKINKIIKIILLLTFSVVGLLFITKLNARFEDLLNGNSLFYRLFAWKRFVEAVIYVNPLLGFGPSNILINFGEYQYLYPQIEIISGYRTFADPHSEWIFMFCSGGLLLLLIYIILNGYIIILYHNRRKLKLSHNDLDGLYLIYILMIFLAQFDINNTTYPTLMTFYLVKASIFNKLTIDRYYELKEILTKILLVVCISISLYVQKKSIDVIFRYQGFALLQVHSKKFIEWNLGNYGAHFLIIDTLKAYHYLNVSGDRYNDNIFNLLIENSRKYNRFVEPSLHLSTQYFAFANNKSALLDVYSNIFYKTLVIKKVINISFNYQNVRVILGDKTVYNKNNNQHVLELSPSLFNELMKSGGSFGKYSIPDLSKFLLDLSAEDKILVKEFLVKIMNYSHPLDMSLSTFKDY